MASGVGLVGRRIVGPDETLAALAYLEPIAFAVHHEDMDVVDQSVEKGAGQPLGAEHAGPFVEREIAGDDGADPALAYGATIRDERPWEHVKVGRPFHMMS